MTVNNAGSPLSLQPLSVQVANMIRADILAGEFEPGEAMRIQAVARRYGVSTTPAREALRFLAAEGLLDYGPRKAVRVAVLSLGDAEDIYTARLFFEPEALRRSVEAATSDWVDELDQAFQALEASHRAYIAATGGRPGPMTWEAAANDWAGAHREFHVALTSACPSPWWRRMTLTVVNEAEHSRSVASVVPPDLPLEDHRRLYEAARDGQVDKAVDLLTEHLQESLDRIRVARLDSASE